MKESDNFYIGWQDKMDLDQKRFLKKRVLFVLVLLPILALAFTFLQRPSNDHSFELGKMTTLTGTYYADPFPLLLLNEKELPDEINKDVLLIGYGKFGAEGIMAKIENEHGELSGRQIRVEGTLIYGDGKTLMELTNEEDALIEVLDGEAVSMDVKDTGDEVAGLGEILDPKCYFGVMKPGEGKIHKSCAIRCISGGIPPVFRMEREDDGYDYYLLVDEKGKKLGKEILPMVGEAIQIKGKIAQFSSWKVLYADLADMAYQ